MIPLTDEKKIHRRQKKGHICKKRFNTGNDNKKYHKVRDIIKYHKVFLHRKI